MVPSMMWRSNQAIGRDTPLKMIRLVVPGLILETDEEKAEWAAGEKRNQLRKQRRIEQY